MKKPASRPCPSSAHSKWASPASSKPTTPTSPTKPKACPTSPPSRNSTPTSATSNRTCAKPPKNSNSKKPPSSATPSKNSAPKNSSSAKQPSSGFMSVILESATISEPITHHNFFQKIRFPLIAARASLKGGRPTMPVFTKQNQFPSLPKKETMKKLYKNVLCTILLAGLSAATFAQAPIERQP